MPDVGEKAPEFNLPTDSGEDVSLAALKGRKFVLYFYPKDNTPGCTTEAIDFSAKIGEFDKLGVTVIGVSRDSLKKHANFRDKHDLRVLLAADEDGATCEAFGVWVEKMNYGRKYMGIERSTFLIDGAGVIRNVWRKVRVKGHADAVLEAAGAL
ncbi:thioredoxin-dependent thiol peroxidase [Sneathiella chungangensis]|uniref:thioredoxin-dependent peroxiredoxin n=1 Tax=Sneathiella chungangensis TaxID=1418234 RepID=A0A845MDR4_9PROT|nr:thioredoxin-dependent thiol peroxidase [Sneathiella chungangensis]MZR21377.1 thioredoxin-dependent thiol peroxidase [Sneathiella chungangensis]